MSITLSIAETLEKNGFRFEYFCGNSDFSLIDDNGSNIKNDIAAVLLLVNTLRVDEEPLFIEEDKETFDPSESKFNAIYYSDEDIAKHYGYTIVCESPMELIASGDRFVSLQCAHAVLSSLRFQHAIEQSKLNQGEKICQ